jgi:hypothetical protein
MDYAKIKSSDGGKGGPQYKDDQPLQGPQGSCAEAAAPNRSGPSGGASQWGNGGSYASTAGKAGNVRKI